MQRASSSFALLQGYTLALGSGPVAHSSYVEHKGGIRRGTCNSEGVPLSACRRRLAISSGTTGWARTSHRTAGTCTTASWPHAAVQVAAREDCTPDGSSALTPSKRRILAANGPCGTADRSGCAAVLVAVLGGASLAERVSCFCAQPRARERALPRDTPWFGLVPVPVADFDICFEVEWF